MALKTETSMDADIFKLVVAPDAATYSTPVARAILSLGFTEEQETQIHRLLDKNNAGNITGRERSLLEAYNRVGNFLSLIKAKARRSLSRKVAKS